MREAVNINIELITLAFPPFLFLHIPDFTLLINLSHTVHNQHARPVSGLPFSPLFQIFYFYYYSR